MKTPLARHPVLLVVGSSPAVWDDLEAFWAMDCAHDVCCVNYIGQKFPCEFGHWFSYHGTELIEMAAGCNSALLHSVHPCVDAKLDHSWRLRDKGGTSAFMAGRCALIYWGYSRVVFAGCGLTNDGYFNGSVGHDSHRYTETFLSAWRRFHPELKDKMRSMSGHTMELYGAPSREWLKNGTD